MQFFLKALFISFIFLAFISCASEKSKNNRSKKGVHVTVDSGCEGFIYDEGQPVDQVQIYPEGTHYVNSDRHFHVYIIRQKSKIYSMYVMDNKGNDIKVNIAVNYSIEKGVGPKLRLKLGHEYIHFVDEKVQGAIKETVGRYTYKEVYSTHREKIEIDVEEILKEEFKDNYLVLQYVEISDIELPPNLYEEWKQEELQKEQKMIDIERKRAAEYLRKAKAEQDSLLQINK